MKKYPRTLHFEFSPEIHNDDKVLNSKDFLNFDKEEYLILEKMDGQNNCMKGLNSKTNNYDGVFARSHEKETQLPWDSFIISWYHQNKYILKPDYWYFVENLYAKHSIEYDKLNNYLFLINIYDTVKKEFVSWDLIEEESLRLNLSLPTIIKKGTFKLKEFKTIMDQDIKTPSIYGKEKEGFVARPVNSFKEEDFKRKVAKYVRKNHVQTDEHWTKHWVKNQIL